MEKNRSYSLDFLKIISTILIVFHHYQQVLNIELKGINFYGGKFYFGYLVEFFFLVSGFLMFNYIEKIKVGLTFKDFFVRRIIRLMPLIIIAAISYEILLCIYPKVFGDYFYNLKPDFWGLIISMLGIQAGWSFENPMINNPMWYISVLVLCYIIFYISTKISISKKYNYIYFYVAIVFLGLSIQKNGTDLAFFNSYTARGYYAFFFGLVFSILFNTYKISKFIKILSIFTVVFITFLILKHYYILERNINYTLTFIYYPSLIIIFNSSILKRILSSKIIGKNGEICFNVYVWHICFILLLSIINKYYIFNINFASYKTMFISTIVLYIFGAVSYYFIEKHLRNIILKLFSYQKLK